jgi:hypothetical protein
MMGFGNNHDRPFPELLAAYADGELDAVGRARVEEWLAAHPEAQSELEGQLRLSPRNRRLWRASAPPKPSEASWAGVFGKVQDALDAPPQPAPVSAARRRSRFRYAFAAAATVIAASIALFMARPEPGPIGPSDQPVPADVFAVAAAADVDILSIDDRDSGVLVVGVPPLTGTVVLAGHGDVDLKHIDKASDGMLPKAQMNDVNVAPMIVAPIATK